MKTIKYSSDNGVATITLNRPESRNSLNSEMLKEIYIKLVEIDNEQEIKILIISGNKEYFASGADIKEIAAIDDPIAAHSFIKNAQAVFDKIAELEKPVIASISGVAIGGGCELALACDLRIAADNAKFGQPEIRIGLLPGAGGTQRLPRVIGLTKAKEMLYTGELIDATEAQRISLVNKVVPVEALEKETHKLAKNIAGLPFYALKFIKLSLNNGINMDLKSALSYEARCFEFLFSTKDQKEGINAFIEKRKASFNS